MSNRSQEDSLQLVSLRALYVAHGRPRPATPMRLGRFARKHKQPITDFGAHSKRWINLFKWGKAS